MHWHGPRFNEFASRVFAIGVMAVSIPALSEAASITFSVVGSGGTSAPVAGFSDSPFWWIDSTGNVAGSALATYGFNPVVALPGSDVWGVDYGYPGSLLISNEFSLIDGEGLTIDMSVMAAHASPWDDIGFAVLLENSSVRAVLANTRPDGINHIGDFGSVPGTTLTSVSPGVATTVSTGDFSGVTTLGTSIYGQATSPADCFSNCITNITTSITPGAGTYQLLFGSFGYNSAHSGPTAVAVKSVNTPEPGTLLLIASGLLILRRGRRQSH
jgi:hypothetical protein